MLIWQLENSNLENSCTISSGFQKLKHFISCFPFAGKILENMSTQVWFYSLNTKMPPAVH